MRSQAAAKAPSGFCKADMLGICQASAAVLTLFGTLWSIGLLF